MFFYSSWLRYFSVSSKTSIHCVDFLITLSCLLLLVHLGIKIGHILSKMRKSRKGENNSIFVVIIKMLVYDCNNWNHVKGKYLTNETDCSSHKMSMNYALPRQGNAVELIQSGPSTCVWPMIAQMYS